MLCHGPHSKFKLLDSANLCFLGALWFLVEWSWKDSLKNIMLLNLLHFHASIWTTVCWLCTYIGSPLTIIKKLRELGEFKLDSPTLSATGNSWETFWVLGIDTFHLPITKIPLIFSAIYMHISYLGIVFSSHCLCALQLKAHSTWNSKVSYSL